MQYVSELIGAPVRDPAGRVIARVADLVDAIRTDVEVALLAAVSPETKA